LQRIAPLGIAQHIIQRGNNRQACFACDQDMAFFASLLDEYSRKFSVSLHAWVFMTVFMGVFVCPIALCEKSKVNFKLNKTWIKYE
jgi:putative transposase